MAVYLESTGAVGDEGLSCWQLLRGTASSFKSFRRFAD